MDNTVELIGHYGSDISHSCSAWTSTVRELTPDKIARIPQLLKFLVTGSDGNPHSSPFEKSALHFLVNSSYVEHIHYLKHRIGVSINGESARYKELKDDKSYIPPDWPDAWKDKLANHAHDSFTLYHQCLESLVNEYGFSKARAKESARYFNLTSTQITQDIQFNFLSFAKFCHLRAVPSAQWEIRVLALKMIELVQSIENNPFEHSLMAWGLTDRLEQARQEGIL